MTVPAVPSTVTSIPACNSRVASCVPTTHGTPSSRDTIAACDVMPPASVTIAAERRISGTQSGDVIRVTSTSPFSSACPCAIVVTTRTRPDATPGLAPSPRASTPAPSDALAASTGAEPSPRVVIGRVCTKYVPAESMANSMSCGTPKCRSVLTARSPSVRSSASVRTRSESA